MKILVVYQESAETCINVEFKKNDILYTLDIIDFSPFKWSELIVAFNLDGIPTRSKIENILNIKDIDHLSNVILKYLEEKFLESTQDDALKLLNCPFCGYGVRFIESKISKLYRHITNSMIFCDNCTICFNLACCVPKSNLIKAWNKRF